MSELKVNKVTPRSGTTVTLGDSGDTIALGSGAAFSAISGTDIALSGNIGLGGATPTTSGTGITFPATASASTNANTLDDYEEGTWTPEYGGSTTNPTVTSYSIRNGTYTKTGNVVSLTGHMRTSGLSGGSGDVQIIGLPFAASSASSYVATGSVYQFSTVTNFATVLRFDSGNSKIDVYFGSSTVQPTGMPIANLGTGSFQNEIGFSMVYQTA
jgi:hypothetical protein